MGLLDWITGTRSAPPGIVRQPASTLRTALLELNRDTSPILVRDGAPEGVDLVAEWKIVDARWYEIFAKAELKRVFKVLMRFDDAQGLVRAQDQEWTVEWRAGVPHLGLSAESFKGQKVEMSFGTAFAFREEDLHWGRVYEYRFKTAEIKDPLIETAGEQGWGWKGVAFGKL